MRKAGVLIVTAIMTAAIASQAHAAYTNVWFNTTSGNWGTGSSWGSGSVPGSTNQAIIQNGQVATVNSNVGTVGAFLIGGTGGSNYGSGAGEVDIVTGGSLTASTGGAQRNADGTTSILTITGGTLAITSLFEVAATPNSNIGTATISNGSLSVSGVGSTVQIGWSSGSGKGTLIVDSRGGTITSSANFNVNSTGTLKYKLDSAGVSSVDLSGTAAANFASGSSLVIDGSSYTGGTTALTLMSGGGSYTYSAGLLNGTDVSITNFGSGYTTNLVLGTNSVVLNITAAPVPEASSIGLLGLAGLALLARRRQAK